jgi:type II secretory pathway pseudopilin PulG
MNFEKGFSVIEVLIAAALFAMFSTGIIAVVLQGFDANRTGSEETIANQYASEGIEAIRSIKNQSFTSLVATMSAGMVRNGSNVWAFSGINNTFGKYTRVASIAAVQRDASGNIIASGGNVDPNIVRVMSTVSWDVSPTRNDSVILTTYMTNFKSGRSGMLAYADTVTGSNAILYKTFDANVNTWSSATALFPDGIGADSNAVQVVRMYASSTRNEKIILSRHSNAVAGQSLIFASVWNGSTWTKQTLVSWLAVSATDHLDFDGTYLANGDFMVVYTDNTTTPKFRTWNGVSWSAQLAVGATALTGTIQWAVVKVRPGTNEVMAAFLTSSSNTDTYYYNGTTPYAAANWTLFTIHSTLAPLNTRRLIDFAFSTNLATTTTGTLIYADSATDKNLTVRVFVANGTGGGSWGTAVNAANPQTNNLAAMAIVPRSTAAEFQACDKDAGATPAVLCYKITFSGTVPTITGPTTIAAATDTGGQRSFDIAYESIAGDPLLAVYSNNTTTPQFKKDTSGTWDGSATPITTTGSPGIFKTIRIIPQDQADDMIILMQIWIFLVFFGMVLDQCIHCLLPKYTQAKE